jgi:antitoxin StbD
VHQLLAHISVSITKLKRSPGTVLELADSEPVALLNRNRPVAYLLSAATYEAVLDQLDDVNLAELIKARRNDPVVEISLGKL